MSKLLNLKVLIAVMMLFIALHNYATAEDRVRIGKWTDDTPAIGGTIEIYKQKGKYYISRQFKDGSSGTLQILKETSKGKTIFRRKDRPGDYFIITKDNGFESWDNLGLIYTARPIK